MSDKAVAKKRHEAPTAVGSRKEIFAFEPRVDILEDEKEVRLVADMPGVDETTVSVDLGGNDLTIRGPIVPETTEKYTLAYQEYREGDWERVFTVGKAIDRDGIKATVNNGVLEVILPKEKAAQPRQIKVKAG